MIMSALPGHHCDAVQQSELVAEFGGASHRAEPDNHDVTLTGMVKHTSGHGIINL